MGIASMQDMAPSPHPTPDVLHHNREQGKGEEENVAPKELGKNKWKGDTTKDAD